MQCNVRMQPKRIELTYTFIYNQMSITNVILLCIRKREIHTPLSLLRYIPTLTHGSKSLWKVIASVSGSAEKGFVVCVCLCMCVLYLALEEAHSADGRIQGEK